MKLTIHDHQEAKAIAESLLAFTKDGLKSAGYFVQKPREDLWYTRQRELMRALERFLAGK